MCRYERCKTVQRKVYTMRTIEEMMDEYMYGARRV